MVALPPASQGATVRRAASRSRRISSEPPPLDCQRDAWPMRPNQAREWAFERMPGGALPPVKAAAKSLQLERKRNSETVKPNESVRDPYGACQLFEPARARSPDPT